MGQDAEIFSSDIFFVRTVDCEVKDKWMTCFEFSNLPEFPGQKKKNRECKKSDKPKCERFWFRGNERYFASKQFNSIFKNGGETT